MLKVIIPVILFLFLVFGISHYWIQANIKNKKKMAIFFGITIMASLITTTYLVIN